MLKGVAFSICASCLFGYLYYFSTLLTPLSGEEIFAFRVIYSIPFTWAGIFLFKQKYFLISHFRRIRATPWLFGIFLLNASITGFEMWLFLWAPNNGEALSVSVGYLILPLVLVFCGRIFLKERISPLKGIAVLSAILGVSIDIFSTGGMSWTSIAVCAYAIYFILRKRFNIADIASFAIELTLLLPLCLIFAWQTDLTFIQQQNEKIFYLLPFLGLLSGVAFLFYIAASNILPINLLGLLSYLEPTVLLVSSIMIGEKISPDNYPLFIGLTLAILFVIFDGVWQVYRKKHPAQRA